jgi:TolA-binding protein
MYADAEMLEFRNQTPSALRKLDSINLAYPNNTLADDILMSKSKIFVKRGEITNAITALKELVGTHSASIWNDDALFTLGELYEKNIKDTEQAKSFYQKLINDHPGSMFSAEARKRFRTLRGDNIGT